MLANISSILEWIVQKNHGPTSSDTLVQTNDSCTEKNIYFVFHLTKSQMRGFLTWMLLLEDVTSEVVH